MLHCNILRILGVSAPAPLLSLLPLPLKNLYIFCHIAAHITNGACLGWFQSIRIRRSSGPKLHMRTSEDTSGIILFCNHWYLLPWKEYTLGPISLPWIYCWCLCWHSLYMWHRLQILSVPMSVIPHLWLSFSFLLFLYKSFFFYVFPNPSWEYIQRVSQMCIL